MRKLTHGSAALALNNIVVEMLVTHSAVQQKLSQMRDFRYWLFQSRLWQDGSEVVCLGGDTTLVFSVQQFNIDNDNNQSYKQIRNCAQRIYYTLFKHTTLKEEKTNTRSIRKIDLI